MTEVRLALEHIGKSWGPLVALSDISLQVPRGMFLSLLGPSGCGKTTLLRVIAGTLAPNSGRVIVDGTDMTRVPTYRRNMGMVFQSFALFPHLSVADNVAFPLEVRGLARTEQRERVAEALRMVHLGVLAERYPRELSGGQQQRVGLARAIVYRPTILLLDEPLSNLDASLREEMRLEISQVTRQLGITAVYVTHDQREALALSDSIAVMNHGHIVQFGTPEEIYGSPVNDFIARFVGYANELPVLLAGEYTRIEADGTVLETAPVRLTGPATAFIHPSAVVLEACAGGGPNRLACTVADLAFMGDHVEYVLRHRTGLQLKAQAPIGAPMHQRGAEIWAVLASDKLIVVPRDATRPT
ncbi:MAG TPA: ABC transporter ATP-binding protein [Xanthobacteraceae bacterium]|jgi:putative spermidine/putrescine transport system ATP-binding protein|nr:ABC transporter ATP-binding protein [Xanthobacteraceae bacterium]